jgi:hypothetical protein
MDQARSIHKAKVTATEKRYAWLMRENMGVHLNSTKKGNGIHPPKACI